MGQMENQSAIRTRKANVRDAVLAALFVTAAGVLNPQGLIKFAARPIPAASRSLGNTLGGVIPRAASGKLCRVGASSARSGSLCGHSSPPAKRAGYSGRCR